MYGYMYVLKTMSWLLNDAIEYSFNAVIELSFKLVQ